MTKKETEKERRDKKNKDLIDRMRAGESLSNFSSEQSWFPKRGKIEKDKKVIRKLFEDDNGNE